jgi:hypothetical protein
MATQEFVLQDGTLEFESDGEWVHSNLPEPDPTWRGTDSNGHEHHAASACRSRFTRSSKVCATRGSYVGGSRLPGAGPSTCRGVFSLRTS